MVEYYPSFLKGGILMEKEVRIKIRSELYEVEESLFSEAADEEVDLFGEDEDLAPEPDVLEINSVGTISDDGKRISISYAETEATGMDGSNTVLTFLKDSPEIVTMMRDGMISATLVFEDGKRHHCIYKTPFMPFEVCVHTKKVENALLANGTLDLDYIVEIRGAKAERTKFKMRLL